MKNNEGNYKVLRGGSAYQKKVTLAIQYAIEVNGCL